MKKYKILIDLDRLKDLNTGLGQVALLFGRELSKISDPHLDFTFLVPKNFKGFFGNNVNYEVVTLTRRYFTSLCKRYDLWYTIHQDSKLFPPKRTPYIVTINDLNFLGEKTPEKAARRLRILQNKVDRAVAVTAISNATKQVIEENLTLKTGLPLRVIYCGVEVQSFPEAVKPDFVPEGRILFNIGVVQPKKNVKVLLPFMKALPEGYCLVLAGNKSSEYAAEVQQEIDRLHLGDRVVLPGMISDEQKYWLYQNCCAVLFPSKFEGMGFPPIEAMQSGKPVFASTFSSIPEVSGDNAYYWQNFDPEYMASFFVERMKEFDADPDKPAMLRKYASRYSWKAAADAYCKLFLEMLEK